jgi:hypothetical protein
MAGQGKDDSLEEALVQRYHIPDHTGTGQAGQMSSRFTPTRLPLLARLQRLPLKRTTIAGAWVAMPYRLHPLTSAPYPVAAASVIMPTHGSGISRLSGVAPAFGLTPTPGPLLRATTHAAPGGASSVAPIASPLATTIQRQVISQPTVAGPSAVGVEQNLQRSAAMAQPAERQEETVSRHSVLMRTFIPRVTTTTRHAGNRLTPMMAPLTMAQRSSAITQANRAAVLAMPTATTARHLIAAEGPALRPVVQNTVVQNMAVPVSSVTSAPLKVAQAAPIMATPPGSLQRQAARSQTRPLASPVVRTTLATTPVTNNPSSASVQRVAVAMTRQPATQSPAHAAFILRREMSGAAATVAAPATSTGSQPANVAMRLPGATATTITPGSQTPPTLSRQPGTSGDPLIRQPLAGTMAQRYLTLPTTVARTVGLGQTIGQQSALAAHRHSTMAARDGVFPMVVTATPGTAPMAGPAAQWSPPPGPPPISSAPTSAVQRVTVDGGVQSSAPPGAAHLPVVASTPWQSASWRPAAWHSAAKTIASSQPTAVPTLPLSSAQAVNRRAAPGIRPVNHNGAAALPYVQRSSGGGDGAVHTTNPVWLTGGVPRAIQRTTPLTADQAAPTPPMNATTPGQNQATTAAVDTQWNNSSNRPPDLERLADEVYAILERRITIERESLGL